MMNMITSSSTMYNLRRQKQRLAAFFALLAFGTIGGWLLVTSQASSGSLALEAEDGTISTSAQKITDSTASGNAAIKFGTDETQPMSQLPFNIPSRSALASSHREVVAYYHLLPLYARNGNNVYEEFLSPNGIKGVNYSVGGKWRQRPYPYIDNTNLTQSRRVKIMYDDIKEAAAIGIDAFFFNITYLSTVSDTWRWQEQLLPMYDAADKFTAENTPGFKVAVDMSALSISKKTAADQNPTVWADSIAPLLKRPSAYKYNGRPVVAVYYVTQLSPSWYTQFAARLENTHEINVAIIPSHQGNTTADLDPYASLMPTLMPILHGWTAPSYTVAPADVHKTLRSWAAARGVKFMGSVGPFQNDRPLELKQMENYGFQLLQNMWTASIQKNDPMVQIVSWNDHEESHNIRPSSGYQYAPYDITSYYLTWYKIGSKPAITRDTLFYAHRMQSSNASYDSSKQTAGPYSFIKGTPVNKILTTAFLKAPADVKVTSGGVTRTHASVPAGITTLDDPFAPNDQPKFSVVRSGVAVVPEFSSAFKTRGSVVWQDLLYRMGGSNRLPISGVQNNLPQERL